MLSSSLEEMKVHFAALQLFALWVVKPAALSVNVGHFLLLSVIPSCIFKDFISTKNGDARLKRARLKTRALTAHAFIAAPSAVTTLNFLLLYAAFCLFLCNPVFFCSNCLIMIRHDC